MPLDKTVVISKAQRLPGPCIKAAWEVKDRYGSGNETFPLVLTSPLELDLGKVHAGNIFIPFHSPKTSKHVTRQINELISFH